MSLATSTNTNSAAVLQGALTDAENRSTLSAARPALEEQSQALRELGQDPALGLLELGDDSRKGPVDPLVLRDEVNELVALMAKLKSHYLEQRTKYLYVSQIVADPEEVIFPSIEDNEALRGENEQAKAKLKEAKRALAARMEELEQKTRQCAVQLVRLQTSSKALNDATKQTLDTRVSLARLRTAHPAPRLTTSSATALLAKQEGDMQTLQDELDRATERKDELKTEVEERTRDVARLGVRRAEVEREARVAAAARGAQGDAERRIAEHAERLSARLTLEKSLAGIQSISRTQDTVSIVYRIPPPVARSGLRPQARELGFNLIFAGEPPRLAGADVDGLEESEENAADLERFVREDDALGLVRTCLRLVRQTLQA